MVAYICILALRSKGSKPASATAFRDSLCYTEASLSFMDSTSNGPNKQTEK